MPQFDLFEIISSFLTYKVDSVDDPANFYAEFDPVPIQAYDELTHRWFNAKIMKFQSLSAMVTYNEWDKYVFKDKISLI